MADVTLEELRRRLGDDDFVLLDVRTRLEFDGEAGAHCDPRQGHIPGAMSVPLAQLERRLSELPRRREVVAYCRGPYCVLAIEAVTRLRARGYRAVRLEAGIPDWRARGLPVETGPGLGRRRQGGRR